MDNISEVVSKNLIELVRRVGDNDYSGVDLGGADPESLTPELLIRELVWHLFPVEGTAQQVKLQRSRNSAANDLAVGFETGINAVAEVEYAEEWRFDNYGLLFGFGSFDSRRKDEKSALWKPEIRGEIKLLDGEFDNLTVSAQYGGGEADNVDYMKFIESLGGIVRLAISDHEVIGHPFALEVSFERYEAFHEQRKGNYSKENVDAYVESELDLLARTVGIPARFRNNFREGRVRSAAFFQTENPEYSGIFCVRSNVPSGGSSASYVALGVPQGDVAHLKLTELTDENLDIAKRFLQAHCFVEADR